MALYKVTLPDGSQYKVEAPEGTSHQALRFAAERFAREEEMSAASQRLAALRAPAPPAPPETTFGGQAKELFKGIIPGAAGLVETAGAGLSALLPEQQEKAVREKLKALREAAAIPAAPGYEESVGRKFGEALGSTLPFFATGPFGLAGRGIAGVLGASAGAGEARQAAEEKGATAGERAAATALGTPVGLLDMLAPGIGEGIRNIMLRAAARGGVEGATEAAQKIAQNLIAKGVYDPTQEILVGSGEEGAYGAGVGALSSLIIDATLGRKARRAAAPAPAPAPAPAAAPEAPAAQPPETTGIMAAIPPSREFPQGELFRKDISAARAQRAAEEGRPPFELTSPEAVPESTQMELPFGMPEKPAQPGQRDLIDEMETQQIREMVGSDETRQIEEMLAQDKQREEAARAKQERLKFESDLAETDARRMEEDRKKTENHRIEMLRAIIEEPSVKNIQATFGDALKIAGYTDTNFTPRERQMIARANNVRAAQPQAPEPVPSAPSELGGMEALIPERRETREPQQLGIPGIGKREAPQPPAQPVAQPVAPETPSTQMEMFGPKGGVLAPQKEAPRATVRTGPAGVGTGVAPVAPNVPSGGAQPAVAPSPAVAPAPAPAGLGGGAPSAPRPTGGKVAPSASVAATPAQPLAQPVAAKTADALFNEIKGLEDQRMALLTKSGRQPAANSPARAKYDALVDQIRTLKDQWARTDSAERAAKKEAPREAPPAAPAVSAPAAPKVAAPPAPKPAKTVAEKKPTKQEALLDEAREGYLIAARGDPDNALNYLAHDMAFAMYPEKNVAKEVNKITLDLASDKIENPKFSKRDEVYAPNTGGKYAKAFFESLSVEEYKRLTAKMRDIFQDYAITEARINTADMIASARKEEELSQNDQTKYGLNLEAPIIGMRMHPAMQARLAAGDIAGALRILSRLAEGRISTVSTRVADYIGDTKVVLSDSLTDEAGKPVAGRFDPKTNTIYMNTSMGMSSHTLLHEAVHAVTSHVLANPSHPITKQLTALYNDAKPYLDTAYGARSLDEFVAEAFSNPEFQFKLAGIPAQGNTTVLQRFIRTIQNLLRRLVGMNAQPVESVMDATDRLGMEIMSPAPDNRGAGSLYSASTTNNSRDPLDIFSKNAMAVPTLNQERIYKFREFLEGTVPNKAKDLVRASLPLNALVDIAKQRIPMATRIGDLVDERAGAENKRNQMIEPVIKRVTDWAEANPAKLDPLNKVIYGSTLFQVDPSKARADYVGKTDESGNKLDEVWDRMHPLWQSLGEDGRGVYKQMRDTYAALHKDVERVLFNRIDDALKDDPAAAKSTKQEIYKRLFASGKIEPYFPLTRTGKYWLSYNADGEFYVEAYETKQMREDAIKELQGTQGVDGNSIQKFANISQINYRNVPATSFVNNILQTLEASKKGASPEAKAQVEQTISEVMNLFLNTLPETSFAQSFRRRKGTLGFNQDAIRALRGKTYNMSRQLANIEYGAKLEAARADMQAHVKANGSQEADAAYMGELNKRIDFAISPNIPEWSKAVTSAGFAMTLGFNVSSAIVNLAQIPVVVMPYLGGRYGYSSTTAAIGRATKVFMGSGLSREAEMLVPVKDDKGNEVEKSMTVRAAPSIDNYDFSDPKNANIKHLETLVRIAGSRGQLNRSMSYDILDVDQGESIVSRINKYSGFAFHHGERMNRQVAMVAAYELELNRLKDSNAKLDDGRTAGALNDAQKEEYAANQAIYLTELTNGGTAAAAAPRIAQGAIGRILFMYKRYGVSMYYMLFKTARDAAKNEDPEVRKAAMKQLGGIYASAALMAGVSGVPLYGIAAMIFNLFRDKDEDDFDTAARKSMPEWAFSGMINATTGLDVASRIGMGDLLFRDSIVKNQTGVIGPLMEQLGGPVFSIASRVERGVQLINEGHTRRGIEQMLPSSISAMSKAERFGREGALTMRGDPIVQEFGAGQVFGQVFGFTPASYTRQLEINSAEKGIDRAANEQKTKMLRLYYVALRSGDADGAAKVAAKMQEFNQKHPTNAITGETIQHSLAQHMKTSQEMVHGVLYSKKMRPEIMRELARFEGESDEDED